MEWWVEEKERGHLKSAMGVTPVKPGNHLLGRAHALERGADALGQQVIWAGAMSQGQSRGEKGTVWTPLAKAGLGLSRVRQDIITGWLCASD